MSLEKKCARYTADFVGYPSIGALDRYNCVIADWTGHLTIFNLISKQQVARIFVGAEGGYGCCTLRSLSVEPSQSRFVAVATKGGYAAIFDLDRQTFQRAVPENEGTVNAVAFSPEGQQLAIGLGFYPLDANRVQPALVELWSFEEGKPKYAGFVALPGVCVDALAWGLNGDEIACASGLIGQKSGFIARLDASTLRPLAFFETSWAMTNRLAYLSLDDADSHLAVITNGAFRVLRSKDGGPAWEVVEEDLPELLCDFALDPDNEEVALSSGGVLDPTTGEPKDSFMFMKECTAMAHRPGGGYLGVSKKGRVCAWE